MIILEANFLLFFFLFRTNSLLPAKYRSAAVSKYSDSIIDDDDDLDNGHNGSTLTATNLSQVSSSSSLNTNKESPSQ
jgi:hypothetical protein